MGMIKIDHSKTDRGIIGNRRSVAGEANLSASYFNDDSDDDRGQGEVGINKKYFGFDILTFIDLNSGKVSLRYDRDSERVRVFLYDDSGSGTGPAEEAPDDEDLSSVTFTFYALGI